MYRIYLIRFGCDSADQRDINIRRAHRIYQSLYCSVRERWNTCPMINVTEGLIRYTGGEDMGMEVDNHERHYTLNKTNGKRYRMSVDLKSNSAVRDGR